MQNVENKKFDCFTMVKHNPFPMKKLCFFILLLATVRLSAQGSLSGVVISPYGAAEHMVSVELFTNVGDRFDDKIDTLVTETLTNTEGYYRIEGIAPGTYAVRFNSKGGDSTCVTITIIGVKIAGGDKSLDVRLEPSCSAFGPLLCIPKRGAPSPKIDVQPETHPDSKVMTKVEFEIIASGEKSYRYTNDDTIVTQYFPVGTGRVRVRVYEHLSDDMWLLVKTYIVKPHVKK